MKTNCLTNFTELKRLRQTVEWELQFRWQVQDYHRAVRMERLLIWIDNKLWAFPSENVLIIENK